MFARQTADGSVKTLLSGRGHYKGITFDEAGAQLAFISDKEEYAQKVSPYRLYHWKAGDAAATEIASAATNGVPKGMVVSEFAPPRFSKDGARVYLGTGAPPPAPPDPNDKTPEREGGHLELQGSVLQRCRRSGINRNGSAATAPSCTSRTSASCSRHARTPHVNRPTIPTQLSARPTSRTGSRCVGPDV